METMMNVPLNQDVLNKQMEDLKPVVMNNIRILAPYNPRDYYYKEISQLADKDYFFETYQVIAWVGIYLRPKRILEIGTRNGGSLVQLLSMYHRFDDLEVFCFDLWREIGSPRAVKKNLKRMNISTKMVEFIKGDSRKRVPEFVSRYPNKRFDYILVDGGHDPETARVDLENVVEHVDTRGILVFDDIGPESYNLIEVWRSFQSAHQDKFHWFEKRWRKGVAWAFRK